MKRRGRGCRWEEKGAQTCCGTCSGQRQAPRATRPVFKQTLVRRSLPRAGHLQKGLPLLNVLKKSWITSDKKRKLSNRVHSDGGGNQGIDGQCGTVDDKSVSFPASRPSASSPPKPVETGPGHAPFSWTRLTPSTYPFGLLLILVRAGGENDTSQKKGERTERSTDSSELGVERQRGRNAVFLSRRRACLVGVKDA